MIGLTIAFLVISFLVFFELIYRLGDKLFKKSSALENEIVERKKAEAQIKASLQEKELLLREIHHRVKNNMQIVASLIRIQLHNIASAKVKEVLKDTQNRIKAMALIHETLYNPNNLSDIFLRDYIRELGLNLFDSFGMDPDRVQLLTEVQNIAIDIDTATPCGLIINELVTNSLKYAFPAGRSGEIRIILEKDEEKDALKLIVSDNGAGLPEKFDIYQTKSLGLSMVINLVEKQLRGKLELKRNNGTEFFITFKEVGHRKRI